MFSVTNGGRLMSFINKSVSRVLIRNLKMSESLAAEKPVQKAITEKLSSNLSPVHLDVINESFMHNVPKGSETHFKVIVVSDKFDNISLVQRHRMVNELLKYELENGVHALSIVAKTPSQWSEDSNVTPSPKCLGGKK